MKDARRIWAASSLIRREVALPGGSPRRWASLHRLERVTSLGAEDGLCHRWDAGEELMLVATR